MYSTNYLGSIFAASVVVHFLSGHCSITYLFVQWRHLIGGDSLGARLIPTESASNRTRGV